MSTDRLNQNFQKFLQTIHTWPTSTIEKSTLIQLLDELCHENPELKQAYNHLPNSIVNKSPRQNLVLNVINNDHQSTFKENPIIRKESNPSSNHTIVKEGELTIKKGSSTLSPLLKKAGFKSSVYCVLSYKYNETGKVVYFTVYQNRKSRKVLHLFILDDNCSFVNESKREFIFKHNSVIESFTTETGTADAWISTFNELSIRRNIDIEEIYEDPENFSFKSESFPSESVLDTPVRPPPRPSRPANFLSPENIYVCLYDYHSSTDDFPELEFTCGDLLYIINTDGSNFYIGYKLILPFKNHNQTTIGFVFKDYITPAYERIE